jgi:polar amino acid transport system substrate-binding protein
VNPLKPIVLALALIILCYPLGSKAAELETVISRGKLIVGVKDNSPPLGFYDQEKRLQGLEIDIARRLAREILGNPEAIVLQPMDNQDRLQAVMDGRVDIAIARVTINPARSRLVDFSPFYYLDGTGIISKNPALKSRLDLRGKAIAVLDHSSTIGVMRSYLPSVQLVPVDSYEEALYLMELGRVDGFAADNSLLTGWVREYPQYRRLPLYLDSQPLGVVMPKGLQYDSLRRKVNLAIESWRREGWLQERASFWGL